MVDVPKNWFLISVAWHVLEISRSRNLEIPKIHQHVGNHCSKVRCNIEDVPESRRDFQMSEQ